MHRCLIVETSSIIRKITRAILIDFGFEVVEATTGREAIAKFEKQPPRLAIVDASLPDRPTLDVLRRMRALAEGQTQILYCTTYFDITEFQRACAAGATDMLIKPFDRFSLAEKLDGWRKDEQEGARANFFNRLSRSEIRTF